MADNRRHLTFDEVHALVLARCIPEPNSGCLLWEGGVSPQNRPGNQLYGGIRLNGKMVKTHRVAWMAAHGEIPDEMQVLHRCDVGLCCNPNHLFLGSNDDNHRDKALKDRGKKRLTVEKAREIHKMKARGLTRLQIGVAMDVDPSTVSRILAGKRRPLSMLFANKE